ncbi:MAG: hypothetical protein IKR93_08945 [Firmicutes bacterium]|nr:hypothetical protein [Bacillota bacterium]
MDTKFLTIKQIRERYGISRKKALEVSVIVGTAPRRKGQTIYVSQAKADEFMGVEE